MVGKDCPGRELFRWGCIVGNGHIFVVVPGISVRSLDGFLMDLVVRLRQ